MRPEETESEWRAATPVNSHNDLSLSLSLRHHQLQKLRRVQKGSLCLDQRLSMDLAFSIELSIHATAAKLLVLPRPVPFLTKTPHHR